MKATAAKTACKAVTDQGIAAVARCLGLKAHKQTTKQDPKARAASTGTWGPNWFPNPLAGTTVTTYGGPDASHTYLHMGNAAEWFHYQWNFPNAPSAYGVAWLNIPSGYAGSQPTIYTRYDNNNVEVLTEEYLSPNRIYCWFDGTMTGTDYDRDNNGWMTYACGNY